MAVGERIVVVNKVGFGQLIQDIVAFQPGFLVAKSDVNLKVKLPLAEVAEIIPGSVVPV